MEGGHRRWRHRQEGAHAASARGGLLQMNKRTHATKQSTAAAAYMHTCVRLQPSNAAASQRGRCSWLVDCWTCPRFWSTVGGCARSSLPLRCARARKIAVVVDASITRRPPSLSPWAASPWPRCLPENLAPGLIRCQRLHSNRHSARPAVPRKGAPCKRNNQPGNIQR